jgi:AcrR family transcriptional regulator
VPKLWTNTIEAHRREVHETILEAAAALVAEDGVRGVTMSEVADRAGIGRATLYKYFPDIEAILLAWHERKVAEHLSLLAEARDSVDGARAQLEAVLLTYAEVVRAAAAHHEPDLEAILHRSEHVTEARRQLHRLVRDMVVQGVAAGDVRDDVAPDELVSYTLHALAAARGARSNAAVRRVVAVVLDGLRAH